MRGREVAGRWLFATDGHEPRARRASDGGLFVAAAVSLVLSSLVADASSAAEERVADDLTGLLGWLDPVWALTYGASGVAVVVLAVVALVRRQTQVAIDVVCAVLLSELVGAVVGRLVQGRWPDLGVGIWGREELTHPSLRVAVAVAALVVAAPALIRPARRVGTVLVGLAGLGTVVLGLALPSNALAGLAVGLLAAATVRLVRGSSSGFPDARRVADDLSDLGLDLTDLEVEPVQREGIAAYRGRDPDGRPLAVRIHGRDARDARYLATAWRALWYRDAGPVLLTRRGQVEHEALSLLVAADAGVPVPSVVAVGMAASTGDAALATTRPAGRTLGEGLAERTDQPTMTQLWDAAARMRQAGIGHGDLDARAVVVGHAGPTLTGFGRAQTGAGPSVLATDVATLLVSTAMAGGQDAALAAGIAAMGPDAVAGALPYLQRAALTPWLRDEVRRRHFDVDELRPRGAAAATGVELSPLAQVRRVRLRDVALMGLTLIAAVTLLSMLAGVGLATIVDLLADARWAWVLTAVVLAQAALAGEAVAVTGAVPGTVPFGPTLVLQSAIKFVNLTVPSAAGKLALTLRYLQRLGLPAGVAISQGALDSIVGFAVQAVLLVLVLPGTDLDVHLDRGESDGLGPLVLVLLAAAAVVVVVVVAVGPVRRRVVPVLRSAVDNLGDLVRSPRRAARLVGGNLAAQLGYALCLGASLAAYGGSASLGELVFVNVAVSLFAGLMPVPGGIGISEAALTAGLVAVGVDHDVAFAAAITHRLASYYLPPVWGYASLRWLTAHGYV